MEFSGFDWDEGNAEKCQKHGVSIGEIEVLFAGPVAIAPTVSESDLSGRSLAIGRTREGRYLFVVFTLRSSGDVVLIRAISARFMHEKEIKSYEKQNPGLPK
jgi:uncharacterized DUF497 family protein